MELETDVAELRDRLDDLEARRAEASKQLGAREDLEALRFELAEVAWRLEELVHTAW